MTATVEARSLRIEPGDRVLLVGDSGSGKSTLLAALAGLLEDEVEGEEREAFLRFDVAPWSGPGGAGLVLQDPMSQLVMATVGDEVAFGCENLGVPEAEIPSRVAAALAAVGLELPLDWPTDRLSGGQAQRLALACALAMQPRLLLLDEPTANLDEAGAAEVVAAVTALAAAEPELALVIAEHRVELWRGLANRAVTLEAGRIVAETPAADLPSRDPLDALDALDGLEGLDGLDALAAGRGALPAPGEIVAAAGGLAVGRDGVALQSGIDLELRAGEALAITGPNGAGKSTLALTLAGLLPPVAGTVTLGGRPDPASWRSRELLPVVGTVFQSPEQQFVARTVEAELAIGPRTLGLPPERVTGILGELLDRLGLGSLAGVSPFSISGGEQRRLSVGTALATGPRLLVLDEPTFGQDPRTWAELVRLLRSAMTVGTAVLVVTHDRELVDALGARELRLPRSQAEPAAPPRAIAARPADPVRGPGRVLDPVARLAAALLIAGALTSTVDPVSAGVALALELAVTPVLGIGWRRYWARTWPVWFAAPLAGLTLLLYGAPSGRHYLDAGLIHLTDGSIATAVTILLRVLALALPAVTLFLGVRATSLADSLAQHLRLPQRFVYGALGAVRLLETFRADWRQLELARRARGVADSGRIRRRAGVVFAMLVLAIRRGTALATAMEARGFGGTTRRSRSRQARFGAAELALLAVAAGIAACGLAAGIALGTFRPLLG